MENAIARARRHGDRQEARRLNLLRRQVPSQDPNDPGYRRLRYVRYCDDWLLGFAGPKHEAEQIKSRIAAFLREELKLELSPSKTLITHATSQAARFLGYDIRAQRCDTKISRNRRAVNAAIGLFVPKTVIRQRCALYMSKGKPAQRGSLLHDSDFTIVAKYGCEYAGARPVLPAGPGRVPSGPPALGHGDLHAQDAGREAPQHGHQDGSKVQDDDRDTDWAAHGLPGQRGTRSGQETTGRPLRRDPAQTSPHNRPHRPAASHGQQPAQRADPPAPGRTLRDLRVHGGPAGPPHPQTRRSQQAWPTRKTYMDAPDGHAAPQDPGDLPPLPRGHPCWTGHQANPNCDHWRAGCGETRTPRSGTGRRNRNPPWATSPGGRVHSAGGSWKRSMLTMATGVAQPSGKPAEHRPRRLPASNRHRASSRPNHPPPWNPAGPARTPRRWRGIVTG